VATQCRRPNGFKFQRKLTLDFNGGAISGDAGLIVLREFDARLGLTQGLKRLVKDPRDRRYVDHDLLTLLRQRVYQIAAGYEDANDALFVRNDPVMQAVAGRPGRALASQPTFSRLENEVDWDSIRLLESEGTEWFCRHGKSQGEIILDMDSTEDPTHGQQSFSFYNAHYDSYMYHPLLIFEGNSGVLLASRLRPGNAMGSRQAIALLRPLVRRLRSRFCRRAIALRADTAFSSPEVLDYAEYAGLHYAIGFARNDRLLDRVMGLCEKADRLWESNADGKRVRLYTSFWYRARSWPRARRVVAKIERTAQGMNLRFLVTNRRGRAEEVFTWYEQRGQAENFIKELKNDLEADRLSCMEYRANAFRLQLHVLAYNLFVLFRRHVLRGTELARAAVNTIRLRLPKIGARVKLSARRLWFHLASGWPGRLLLLNVLDRLAALGPPR
jgi:hypothetical protein